VEHPPRKTPPKGVKAIAPTDDASKPHREDILLATVLATNRQVGELTVAVQNLDTKVEDLSNGFNTRLCVVEATDHSHELRKRWLAGWIACGTLILGTLIGFAGKWLLAKL
jgi:hypothetical protein